MKIIRRFKPAASFSPLGRVVHEIRIREDGAAVYWLQPPGGPHQDRPSHTEVVFDGGHSISDFVNDRNLIEIPV